MKSPMFYPFSCFFKSPDSGRAASTNYQKKQKQRNIIFIPLFTASCKNTIFLLTWMFCWTFHLFGRGWKLNWERALPHDFFHALAHILDCHKQKEVNVQTAGLSCQGSSLMCIIAPHIVDTKHYELEKKCEFYKLAELWSKWLLVASTELLNYNLS